MLRFLIILWNITLLASVLGFWPSIYILYHYWENGKDNFVERWVPIVFVPWIVAVGIFLTIFVILLFFVVR